MNEPENTPTFVRAMIGVDYSELHIDVAMTAACRDIIGLVASERGGQDHDPACVRRGSRTSDSSLIPVRWTTPRSAYEAADSNALRPRHIAAEWLHRLDLASRGD